MPCHGGPMMGPSCAERSARGSGLQKKVRLAMWACQEYGSWSQPAAKL